jgi:hypothetical protein
MLVLTFVFQRLKQAAATYTYIPTASEAVSDDSTQFQKLIADLLPMLGLDGKGRKRAEVGVTLEGLLHSVCKELSAARSSDLEHICVSKCLHSVVLVCTATDDSGALMFPMQ